MSWDNSWSPEVSSIKINLHVLFIIRVGHQYNCIYAVKTWKWFSVRDSHAVYSCCPLYTFWSSSISYTHSKGWCVAILLHVYYNVACLSTETVPPSFSSLWHTMIALFASVLSLLWRREGYVQCCRWTEWCLEIHGKSVATDRPLYGQVGGRRELASTAAAVALLVYEAQTDLFVTASGLEASTYGYFET
jgi:hypothetical protein